MGYYNNDKIDEVIHAYERLRQTIDVELTNADLISPMTYVTSLETRFEYPIQYEVVETTDGKFVFPCSLLNEDNISEALKEFFKESK